MYYLWCISPVSETDQTNEKQVKSILKSSFESFDWWSYDSIQREKKVKS